MTTARNYLHRALHRRDVGDLGLAREDDAVTRVRLVEYAKVLQKDHNAKLSARSASGVELRRQRKTRFVARCQLAGLRKKDALRLYRRLFA